MIKPTPNKKVVEVLETQGWTLHSCDFIEHSNDILYEISKPSPAGEDFLMCIIAKSTSTRSFLRGIIDYGFCPDEHAKMWIEAMNRVDGVPTSVMTIANDAVEIENMINNLILAFVRIWNAE